MTGTVVAIGRTRLLDIARLHNEAQKDLLCVDPS
jgi:hypothetical protein